ANATKTATVAAVAPSVGYVATADLHVEDNIMLCGQAGVSFAGLSAHVAETRLAGNLVVGCRTASIVMLGNVLGRALPASHLDIRGTALRTLSEGIVTAPDDTRIVDNDLVGTPASRVEGIGGNIGGNIGGDGADGIALRLSDRKATLDRCIVRGNRVTGAGR